MAIRVVAAESMSTGTASVSGADGAASISLPGRITAYMAAPVWHSALDTLARNPRRPIIVDASGLEYVDNVGAALLFDLIRRDRPTHSQVEIRNLAVNVAALVREFDPGDFVAPPPGRHSPARNAASTDARLFSPTNGPKLELLLAPGPQEVQRTHSQLEQT